MTTAVVRAEAEAFLRQVTAALAPLDRAARLREWEANVRATPETLAAATAAEAAVAKFLSDRGRFDTARRLLADPELRDPLLRRQLTLFVHAAAEEQLPEPVLEDLVHRAKALEGIFHSYRTEWEGRRVSNNAILDCLKSDRDVHRRRDAWAASKAIGGEVAVPLRELARRRNAAARSLGYRDYYVMRLELQEIEESELFRLFDDLRAETETPFRAEKQRVDAALARRYGIQPGELRPWHYEDPFFQEAPQVFGDSFDPLFRGRDIVAIARAYIRALSFELDAVIDRSDLFERAEKDQHAFCIDIDRAGDVRVLSNLRTDLPSMETLLHELGHAAYDVHIPRSLPWLVRQPAHMSTTEGVAMWMGRTPLDPDWHVPWLGLEPAESARLARGARPMRRFQLLLTARWVMVMTHFERALYADPERTDLDHLWWSLVEELQGVRRPEGRQGPDWAAKIHLTTAPVYYHNYLLGEVTASQIDATLRREVGREANRFAQPGPMGAFLRERLFPLGARFHWQDTLRQVTGRRLSPEDFVADCRTRGARD